MKYSLTYLIFMMACSAVCSSPMIENDRRVRYEEYVIEHEISATQAKNSALTIALTSFASSPGCQNCTDEEIRYCSGSDLINDHCCCDKRFSESLPFIPHTCYSGTTLCRTIAADCEEYYRRKLCCCDRHVLRLWKQKLMKRNNSTRSEFRFHSLHLMFLNILFLIYYPKILI
ncbi:uncharacterized protein LOC123307376 [Coccinella septempunctata]|uniref:uncharacterized protein LOC123307376 n=1 Tax=Coccinella septempunctata TaxID=41139 RepID=UPI001D08666B|nr:uncharacterized protein LOC123307376 [Coccinella septempunctata]